MPFNKIPLCRMITMQFNEINFTFSKDALARQRKKKKRDNQITESGTSFCWQMFVYCFLCV